VTNISTKNCKRAVRTLALLGATMLTSAAWADQVTLKSADGTVNLVGEFVDFKDDNYIIRTALGDLRISAERVRCEGAACPDLGATEANFTFEGSDTIGIGMMPLLMSGYAGSMEADAELTNTGANEVIATLIGDDGFGDELESFRVSSTSDADAFQALLANRAQLAMASRRILPAEARALKDAGAGNMVSHDQEHIIAIDSVMVITHPSNPVSQITMDQLRDIYDGKITNWKQVGGNDAPITVINYAPDSATREFFESRLFATVDGEFAGSSQIATDDQVMAAMVNSDDNAIGFVGFAFQRGAKPLTLVNACGLPTSPDVFSAKTEEYELNRRLYFYTTAATDEKIHEFIRYVESPDADGVIAKAGFIDQGIVTRRQDATSDRAALLKRGGVDRYESRIAEDMLQAMLGTERLSTTFRFKTGVAKLDKKATNDLLRLVSYLKQQPTGTQVTVVGFTDDVGAFEANRRLSVSRADQVLQEIRNVAGGELNHIDFQVAGYGELAPSACNITDAGKAINRRVEIWMANAG